VSSQLRSTAALPARREPPLPTDYKAGLAQSLFGLFEEEINMLLLLRTEHSCFGYPVAVPITQFQSMNLVFKA